MTITLLPLPADRLNAAARELAQRSVTTRRDARRAYVRAHCAKMLADIQKRKESHVD